MRFLRTSYSGIMGGRRACLGRNGKYSVENCNGSLWAQGIGQVQGIPITETYDLFVPLGSDSLVTADSLTFKVVSE